MGWTWIIGSGLSSLAILGSSLRSQKNNSDSSDAKASNQTWPRIGHRLGGRDDEGRDGKENACGDTQPGEAPHHRPAWRRRTTISAESAERSLSLHCPSRERFASACSADSTPIMI